MKTRLRRILSCIQKLRLRCMGAEVGSKGAFSTGIVARLGFGHGRVVVGDECTIESGVVLDAYGGTIAIGRNSFIGPYTVIYGHGGVKIGPDCLIAAHCRIVSSNHEIPPLGVIIRSRPDVLRPVSIGHDVWLGAGVTVLGGVKIGDGCVVGAGAVVTKDLPPGSIAVGIPARIIDRRK